MQKRLPISSLLIASLILPLFGTPSIGSPISYEQSGHVQVVDSSSDELILDITSSDYQVEEESTNSIYYQRIGLPGEAIKQNSGEPQLPVINRLVGIPPEGEIRVVVLEDKSVTLPGEWNLLLAPYPAALEQDLQEGKWQFAGTTSQPVLIKDHSSLSSSFSVVTVADDAWLRDQRIVRIAIHPFEYRGSSGELIWHHNIRIKIEFPEARSTDQNVEYLSQKIDPAYDKVLSQNLINYQVSKDWRGIPTSAIQATQDDDQSVNLLANNTSQTRYRIPIQVDGLYRITYETLFQVGVINGNVDFNLLSLSCQGLAVDLFLDDNDGDGILESGEAIEFFGQKFYGDWMAQRYTTENQGWLTYSMQNLDGTYAAWKPTMNATMLEKYTDENVYWLSVNPVAGAHIREENISSTQDVVTKPFLSASQFTVYLPLIRRYGQATSARHTRRAEESLRWTTLLFGSEETWYWEEIYTTNPVIRSYSTTLDNIAGGSYTATLKGEIVAKNGVDGAGPDHHIRVYINDSSHTTPLVDDTWDGKSRFQFDAQISQSKLVEGVNILDIEVLPTAAASLQDLFFDWFEIDYQRNLGAMNNQLLFQADQAGAWQYHVTGFTSNHVHVFDISDRNHPTENWTIDDWYRFS